MNVAIAKINAHFASVRNACYGDMDSIHAEALRLNASFDTMTAWSAEAHPAPQMLAVLPPPESVTESDALIDAVPPFLAQRVTTLQAAVRDLIEFGYGADGVRALVEAELLAVA